MVKNVTFKTYNAPFRFEAGTMIFRAIGLAKAIDYLISLGIEDISKGKNY